MPENSPLFVDIGQGLSVMIGLPTIASWDTVGRPKEPKMGTIGFNTHTNNLEYWDGRVWFATEMSES